MWLSRNTTFMDITDNQCKVSTLIQNLYPTSDLKFTLYHIFLKGMVEVRASL